MASERPIRITSEQLRHRNLEGFAHALLQAGARAGRDGRSVHGVRFEWDENTDMGTVAYALSEGYIDATAVEIVDEEIASPRQIEGPRGPCMCDGGGGLTHAYNPDKCTVYR